MKYLFLDVETTGIESVRCAIIQLSGIIEIDGIVKETFDFKIKPHIGATIDTEALAVSGVTQNEIMTFPEPFLVFKEFTAILEKYINPYDKKDKFFFIAYNAVFDLEFIRAFFARNQNNFFSSYFWHPYIDVMTLSMEYLKEKRPLMPNFKLLSVASMLSIPLDKEKLHNALYDIEITKIIYEQITHKTPVIAVQNNNEDHSFEFSESKKEDVTPIIEKKEFFDGLFE